jgi:tryptophan synthase alpha chain
MPASNDGITRLESALAAAATDGRPALIPYLTAGYPGLSDLPTLVRAAARGGADVIEIGVPFSDPLADGPVLQAISQDALARGFTLKDFWPMLAEAAQAGPPVVILTYVNPVLAQGAATFLDHVQAAEASGLIIPDLPWLEAGAMKRQADARGLGLIPLAAPTSTDSHLAAISGARGFVYGVSVTGVTGIRTQVAASVLELARRLKASVRLPVAIGFGISTPEQAVEVGREADAIIVGTALMQALKGAPDAMTVERFVRDFRTALDKARSQYDTRGAIG